MYYKLNLVCYCVQKALLVFPLFLIAIVSSAQDSTLRRLMIEREDTIKVKKLIDYGRDLLNVDNVAAEPVFKAVIQISEGLHYHPGVGRGLLGLAYIRAQRGAYREAIDFYTTAAVYLRKANLVNSAAECMNTIATIYDFLGKRDSAIAIYMQSVKLTESTGHLASLGSTYCYIGVLYYNADDYEKAVFYETKAVDLLRKARDTVYLIEALTELGDSYAKLKTPHKGLPIAYEALWLANHVNRTNSDRSILATAYYTLSALHLENRMLDSATAEAKLCVAHSLASGDMNTYVGGVGVLSDCYFQAGQKKERYAVLMKVLETCKKIGNVMLLNDTYQRLSDAAAQLGRFEEAYGFHKSFVLYKDSLFNKKNQSLLSEMAVKYQTDEKEKTLAKQQLQIAQKNLHLQQSKQHVIYSVSAFLIALAVTAFLIVRQKSKRKQHQRQLLSIQQQQELQLLQAVINGEEKERSRIAKDLHDGVAGMLAAVKMHFGTIADVKVLQQIEGFQQGMGLLNEASEEIRKTAHNLMPEVLLAKGLDAALQRYCNNISNTKLQVQYDSWGDSVRYKESFELAIYRIVQELLHNVVKHSGASQAIVQMSIQGYLLSLTIEDNGIGLQHQPQSEGTGIQSVQKRVEAMNGKMDIDSSEGSGVSAYLEFDTRGLELHR